MTATVSILVARRDNVLKIPKAALRFQPRLTDKEREELSRLGQRRPGAAAPGGGTTAPGTQRQRWQNMPKVWVVTPEGFLKPIAVRLGISDDQYTELLDDTLSAGQELVIGGMDQDGKSAGSSRSSAPSGPPQLRF